MFTVVWLGAVWFADMDLGWRITMPVAMVALMAFILVRRADRLTQHEKR